LKKGIFEMLKLVEKIEKADYAVDSGLPHLPGAGGPGLGGGPLPGQPVELQESERSVDHHYPGSLLCEGSFRFHQPPLKIVQSK
jgi:hypothetical protein